jgi:hypothetical protein
VTGSPTRQLGILTVMAKYAQSRDRPERNRFSRAKHAKIAGWPVGREPAAVVASLVSYVGSPEHKSDPSAGPPRLRHTASRCEPGQDFATLTTVLRQSIVEGRVGGIFEGRFPKYVWGVIGRVVYEARHIRGPEGTYKGFALEHQEHPEDPLGLLP